MSARAPARVATRTALSPKVRRQLQANADRFNAAREPVYPKPQPGKQEMFFKSPADIVIYGGAAGSGKSYCLLAYCAREYFIKNPLYNCVIFRQSYGQITNPGGLADESRAMYSSLGGRLVQKPFDWKFPTGAKISFRHLQHRKDQFAFQGAQIALICWDELTHWQDDGEAFWYLMSRNRSISGIKPRIRATCNPDADSWVANLISWWIDQNTGYAIESRCGVIRWFVRQGNDLVWADDPAELKERFPDIQPKSFTFIGASIYDNQYFLQRNPEYLSNLQSLHPVERERLLKGNWLVRYEAGKVFERTWFQIIDKVPDDWRLLGMVRFWDLAATAAEIAKTEHCYTSGTLMAKYEATIERHGHLYTEFVYVILDNLTIQKKAGDVEAMIIATADNDGPEALVRIEREGGSAGKMVENVLKEKFSAAHPGFSFSAIAPMGDKLTRSLPLSTAASRGRIYLIKAGWNLKFLNAMTDFDGSRKPPPTNDIVDSASGAHTALERECSFTDAVVAHSATAKPDPLRNRGNRFSR